MPHLILVLSASCYFFCTGLVHAGHQNEPVAPKSARPVLKDCADREKRFKASVLSLLPPPLTPAENLPPPKPTPEQEKIIRQLIASIAQDSDSRRMAISTLLSGDSDLAVSLFIEASRKQAEKTEIKNSSGFTPRVRATLLKQFYHAKLHPVLKQEIADELVRLSIEEYNLFLSELAPVVDRPILVEAVNRYESKVPAFLAQKAKLQEVLGVPDPATKPDLSHFATLKTFESYFKETGALDLESFKHFEVLMEKQQELPALMCDESLPGDWLSPFDKSVEVYLNAKPEFLKSSWRFHKDTHGKELAEILEKRDLAALAPFGRRYFYTPAGIEALSLYALHLLNSGEPLYAAAAINRVNQLISDFEKKAGKEAQADLLPIKKKALLIAALAYQQSANGQLLDETLASLDTVGKIDFSPYKKTNLIEIFAADVRAAVKCSAPAEAGKLNLTLRTDLTAGKKMRSVANEALRHGNDFLRNGLASDFGTDRIDYSRVRSEDLEEAAAKDIPYTCASGSLISPSAREGAYLNFLIRTLEAKQGDLQVRYQAGVAIGKLRRKAAPAIPALLAILEDGKNNPVLRVAAIHALSGIGPTAAEKALPYIVAGLNEKEDRLRFACVTALAGFQEKAVPAVPKLVELAAFERGTRIEQDVRTVLYGLAEAAPNEVAGKLISLLGHSDSTLKISAIDVLGWLGKAAIPALPHLFILMGDKDDDLALVAALALGKIGRSGPEHVLPRLKEMLTEKDPLVQRGAFRAIRNLREFSAPLVPTLMEGAKDKNAVVAIQSVAALEAVGPEASPAVPVLIGLLDDIRGNPGVKEAAAKALEEIGEKASSAVPSLIATFSLPASQGTLKGHAAAALGKIGKSAHSAVPHLLILLSDPDQFVYLNAKFSLTSIAAADREKSLPILRKALKETTDIELGKKLGKIIQEIEGE